MKTNDKGRQTEIDCCGKHSLRFEQARCYNGLVWLQLSEQGFQSCIHHTRAGHTTLKRKNNNSLNLFSCEKNRYNYFTYL